MAGDPVPSTTAYWYGPVVIKLADAAGASCILVQNAAGDYVAKIDSQGNVFHIGAALLVDSITGPA